MKSKPPVAIQPGAAVAREAGAQVARPTGSSAPVDENSQRLRSHGERCVATFELDVLPELDVLYRFALQLTNGDAARAEDFVQETLLRAFRTRDRFEPGTSQRAWLLAILRRFAIDQHRRERARPRERSLVQGSDRPLCDETITHDGVAGAALGEAVEHALAQLPTSWRHALLLGDVEDLSYREVATVLGCPIGTVRSRISRARAALRELLRDHALQYGLITSDAVGATSMGGKP
jgi:RNA polymerase sigma-70 factor (ECF subfamily)